MNLCHYHGKYKIFPICNDPFELCMEKSQNFKKLTLFSLAIVLIIRMGGKPKKQN